MWLSFAFALTRKPGDGLMAVHCNQVKLMTMTPPKLVKFPPGDLRGHVEGGHSLSGTVHGDGNAVRQAEVARLVDQLALTTLLCERLVEIGPIERQDAPGRLRHHRIDVDIVVGDVVASPRVWIGAEIHRLPRTLRRDENMICEALEAELAQAPVEDVIDVFGCRCRGQLVDEALDHLRHCK